jgi:predicted hydrocarbon binding protein
MKQAKNKKKAASGRKPVARKAPARKAKPKPRQLPQAADLESLLAKSLAYSTKDLSDAAVIEDLIYALTPSMSRAAYNFGYSIGMEIRSSSKKEDNLLIPALRRLGFRHIKYYPFIDALAINAGSKKYPAINIGARIHFFESGIIAGYLSAHSGEPINTIEKECIYYGNKECRFVSYPGRVLKEHTPPSIEDVIDAIATHMHGIKFSSRSEAEYHMLPMLPMAKQPLRSEVTKLLYLIGIEISQRHMSEDPREILENLARYFGMSGESIEIKQKSASAKLSCSYYNSNADMAELSVAMLRGFIKGRTSKEPNVYINIDKNMNYVIELTTAVHK